ncbi:hypothetical protein GCM10008957_53980 [Deinococcus ruber]|uniref:ParB/Sulfiredoxin domain-containing protein n=1 Tax=Deinococcus ruber TaxID=1848197 RepID=A0A918FHF2_9DEIO|nr:hypothetical protein GCM10008957_53980 [Deinococcus ruber]
MLEDTTPQFPTPVLVKVRLDDIEEATLTGASNDSVADMEEKGQQEPVRLYTRGEGQLLGIADGNRRIQNARRLGWTHVEAYQYPALTVLQVAQIQLSAHNRAPNLITEARSLAVLSRSGLGTDERELARAAGLPLTRIRKLLKLLVLPDDILELTGSVLSSGAAESVAGLSPEHRIQAIQLIRQRAGEEKGRFTHEDLKEIQRVRDTALATMLSGLSVSMPVVTLRPVDQLAAQVRIMCREAGVSAEELWAVLSQHEAPQPQPQPPINAVPAGSDPWDLPVPVPAAVISTPGVAAVSVDPWDLDLPQVAAIPSPAPAETTFAPAPWEIPEEVTHPGAAAAPTPPAAPPPARPRSGMSFAPRSFGNVLGARK